MTEAAPTSPSDPASDVVYVALGSNLGDRAAILERARRAMARLPDTRLIACSDVEETAPLGQVAQGPFLNQMVALRTTLSPHALLSELHAIERAEGRERRVRWGPRTLDLDIVLFGQQRVADTRLTVPHPAVGARDFWRRQLAALGIRLTEEGR